MSRHTAARADRFSAALARFTLSAAALLAALGMAALILHAPLPAWAWACVLPDTFTVLLYGFTRTLAPRPDPRTYGT